MPVKLTLEETFNAYIALKKFSSKEMKQGEEFLSYKIGSLETKTHKSAQLFEKIRTNMIKKHGEEDKEGNVFVSKNNEDAYQEELNKKLYETESQMEADLTFDTIKLSLFKGVDIAPEFFRGMGKLIEP